MAGCSPTGSSSSASSSLAGQQQATGKGTARSLFLIMKRKYIVVMQVRVSGHTYMCHVEARDLDEAAYQAEKLAKGKAVAVEIYVQV